jgi:hypothetical protein
VASIIIIPWRFQKHPLMKSNIRCSTELGCTRCAKKEMIFGSNSCTKVENLPKKIGQIN